MSCDRKKKEREDFKRLPVSNKDLIKMTGVPALWGEPQFIPSERVGARPTLEVNGLLSGFTGQGSKTVLPAWAMAKISCRLVPDQTPEEVAKQMKAYLKKNAPKTIKWELINLHNAGAAITDSNSAGVQALAKALKAGRGCCRGGTGAHGRALATHPRSAHPQMRRSGFTPVRI